MVPVPECDELVIPTSEMGSRQHNSTFPWLKSSSTAEEPRPDHTQ